MVAVLFKEDMTYQDHKIYSDGQLCNTTTEDLDMFQFVKLTDIWDKLHCVKIHDYTPLPSPFVSFNGIYIT